GWITFDPTPLAGRTEQAALFGRLSMYMDAFQSAWEEWVINYDFLHQIVLARELRGNTRDMTRDSQATFRRYYRSLVLFVERATDWVLARRVAVTIVLAIAVAAMWLLLLRSSLARWFRERGAAARGRDGTARPEDATLVYLRLLRLLGRKGIRKHAAQTPNEFAESVGGDMAPAVRDFPTLYVQARFGHPAQLRPQLTALLGQNRAGG